MQHQESDILEKPAPRTAPPPTLPRTREAAAETVSREVLRATRELGLNGAQVAQAIGLSEATVSRLRTGTAVISPTSKSWELGLLLVRVRKALGSVVGEDPERIRNWMWSENSAIGATPARRIERVQGLVGLLAYLESRASRSGSA